MGSLFLFLLVFGSCNSKFFSFSLSMSGCCGYGLEILVAVLPLGHVLQGTCGMLEWWAGEDLTTTADYRQWFFFCFPFEKDCTSKKREGIIGLTESLGLRQKMEFEDVYKRRANRSFGGDWIKLYMSNLHTIAFVAFV